MENFNIEVVETTNPEDIKTEYASSNIDFKNNKITIYTKEVLHAIKLEIAKNTLIKMKTDPIYRFANSYSGLGIISIVLTALAFFMLDKYLPHIAVIGFAVFVDTMIIVFYSSWICDNICKNAIKKVTESEVK